MIVSQRVFPSVFSVSRCGSFERWISLNMLRLFLCPFGLARKGAFEKCIFGAVTLVDSNDDPRASFPYSVMQWVAVWCSELQCVAVSCSVMQWVAVWCSELQCDAVSCSVMQCSAVWCSELQCVAMSCSVCCPSSLNDEPRALFVLQWVLQWMLQWVAVSCSVLPIQSKWWLTSLVFLQCVEVYCSMLQCVAVGYSELQCAAQPF